MLSAQLRHESVSMVRWQSPQPELGTFANRLRRLPKLTMPYQTERHLSMLAIAWLHQYTNKTFKVCQSLVRASLSCVNL